MAELFSKDRTVITKHINNVFEEGELDEKSNVQILHIANSDRPVKYYNLDVIISVGYRVKSHQGTISHQQALEKATSEYNRFRELKKNEISAVEKDFIKQIETTANKLESRKKS